MCDICVMKTVKERMLSRRDMFKGSAALAAAASVGVAAPARADGHGNIRDMTHAYDETFPTFFGEPGIAYEQVFNWDEHNFNLLSLTINEHTGTHIDAPLHFSKDGQSVDEIDIGSLYVPLCVVDIRDKAASDPDAQVTPEDIETWISQNGDIPDRACVAMNSGWASKVDTPEFRGAEGDVLHFPGFHVEAAQMLLEQSSASCIAVDTLSLDHGPSPDFATHYEWLPTGRYGIECLAGLDEVPASGSTLIVGAPKHKRGTGGPARIFAVV